MHGLMNVKSYEYFVHLHKYILYLCETSEYTFLLHTPRTSASLTFLHNWKRTKIPTADKSSLSKSSENTGVRPQIHVE